MSTSSTLDRPTDAHAHEQRIELSLPDGRHVVVVARYWLNINVPVVNPPKPKGPELRLPVGDGVVVIETDVVAAR